MRRRRWCTRIALVGCLLGTAAVEATSAGPTGPARANTLAFIYLGDVYVINADGTGRKQLTELGSDDDPVWSPDARRIAFTRSVTGADGTSHSALYVMDADGTGEVRLSGTPIFGSPTWSPDSRRIAFAGYREGARFESRTSEIYVIDADGGAERRLTRNGAFDSAPSWAPSRRIAFVRDTVDEFALAGRRAEIHAMNADGSGRRQLTRNRVGDSEPSWSPDGKRLVFVRSDSDADSADGEIYTMRGRGGLGHRLTRNRSGQDYGPTWSPSGRRIAFTRQAQRFGVDGLFVMSARGGSAKRLGTGHSADWSPTGRWIAFTGFIGRTNEVVLVAPDGSPKRRLTRRGGAFDPAWRP
jgi:TolB protein